MNLFDRNRNELSRYFYDLSKAVLISYIAVSIFQRALQTQLIIAGLIGTVLPLLIGMILRKDSGC